MSPARRRGVGLPLVLIAAWVRLSAFVRPAAPRLHAKAVGVNAQGLDARDVAFMERLRNLAREALTWEHLSEQQWLVWATALDLDVVPVQETGLTYVKGSAFVLLGSCLGFVRPCRGLVG